MVGGTYASLAELCRAMVTFCVAAADNKIVAVVLLMRSLTDADVAAKAMVGITGVVVG